MKVPVLQPIRAGNGKKLFLYSDLFGFLAWAADSVQARDLAKLAGVKPEVKLIRVAHVGIPAPGHYHKPNGELAFDAIERIPTMRGLVNGVMKGPWIKSAGGLPPACTDNY